VGDGLTDGRGVQAVEQNGFRAGPGERIQLVRTSRGADHLMAALDEVGDEIGTDGTRRPGDEYSHLGEPPFLDYGLAPETKVPCSA
jgi:hypothetical protein